MCKHPSPTIITYDCGNELLGNTFNKTISMELSIRRKQQKIRKQPPYLKKSPTNPELS